MPCWSPNLPSLDVWLGRCNTLCFDVSVEDSLRRGMCNWPCELCNNHSTRVKLAVLSMTWRMCYEIFLVQSCWLFCNHRYTPRCGAVSSTAGIRGGGCQQQCRLAGDAESQQSKEALCGKWHSATRCLFYLSCLAECFSC
ncbi:hypothetical protein TraAM80_05105 [Trypanosoma rangeli]|uniref:Uncharacterized protein n=1 Tax=Trypanosoma rangeli TaxID=5698 RepID=A0A3R7NCW1_TRYRA|nr:uncharacterized protein TraAM80_05105 [Trypanosoma rangeli]RNF04513.1 hypothetical protein TraAM80_05105 [Trypanosoma rangeli]|eukprot:RNF04513.1 hypothetical protein TraAM80_05105 [Trypanosoma rangeli]